MRMDEVPKILRCVRSPAGALVQGEERGLHMALASPSALPAHRPEVFAPPGQCRVKLRTWLLSVSMQHVQRPVFVERVYFMTSASVTATF